MMHQWTSIQERTSGERTGENHTYTTNNLEKVHMCLCLCVYVCVCVCVCGVSTIFTC